MNPFYLIGGFLMFLLFPIYITYVIMVYAHNFTLKVLKFFVLVPMQKYPYLCTEILITIIIGFLISYTFNLPFSIEIAMTSSVPILSRIGQFLDYWDKFGG